MMAHFPRICKKNVPKSPKHPEFRGRRDRSPAASSSDPYMRSDPPSERASQQPRCASWSVLRGLLLRKRRLEARGRWRRHLARQSMRRLLTFSRFDLWEYAPRANEGSGEAAAKRFAPTRGARLARRDPRTH
jgi:hypothetical protein